MQLNEAEQKALEKNQALIELRTNAAWLVLREGILEAIESIDDALDNRRMADWDEYLTLFHRKDGMVRILGQVDNAEAHVKRLTEKAAAPTPKDGPATGDLA